MSLEKQVMDKMKVAMKAKDSVALSSLRSIKSEILKAKTSGDFSGEMTEAEELKLIQKLVKQRKDSAQLYKEQNREDLAEEELNEVKILEDFLPEQMSEEAIAKEVKKIIEQTGASSMKDMGKVMGIATKQMAGKAEGAVISKIVKQELT
ncbi:GatB/YqeY domain-containing protein [Mesohalobacter halotolerans]|uniref:GatB/YqeY domain-containing protein n=1 Tax=Mesohalobacter halotolerans TaxID=1883405 RepID=A0A4U5TP42_9FLAO|nr:GatB/YqeY domain-containing protein [Mesohalobacter halotolerans]TKS55847.1 GatB/YqeY domain-containing protein [Mesohalobacter halotolerans]